MLHKNELKNYSLMLTVLHLKYININPTITYNLILYTCVAKNLL